MVFRYLYLNKLGHVWQVFDFRTSTWSALNPARDSNQLNHENDAAGGSFPALAGHSLVNIQSFLFNGFFLLFCSPDSLIRSKQLL